MANKLALALGGVTAFLLPFVTKAQFTVSTSTQATDNGSFLTDAYEQLINMLKATGTVKFLIILTILGIVVWLAVKGIRHVFNS